MSKNRIHNWATPIKSKKETTPTEKKPRKKRLLKKKKIDNEMKKIVKKAKAKKDDADVDLPWDEPKKKDNQKQTSNLGVELALDCPVCRTVDSCDCEENDRAFIRRTRFENDVEKVARCNRCEAPMSVIYLPRGALKNEPHRLSQFSALYACSLCSYDSLATIVSRIGNGANGG